MSDLGAVSGTPTVPTRRRSPFWPLQEPLFRSLWIAAVVSYTGSWMQNVGAGWLMTSLTMSPLMVGLVQAAILGGLVGRLINRWGEERLVRGGLVLAAAGYLLITLTRSVTTLAIYAAVAGAGHSLMRPSIASLISKRTQAGQGLSIGIMDSFDSLGRILGPAWAGWVYHAGIGLPYISAALVLLITFAISLVAFTRHIPVQAN